MARKRDKEAESRSNDRDSNGTLNLEDDLRDEVTSEDPDLAAEELEDELRPHSEDLDSEGIPDLDDELRAKEITGDAQEGLVPPRDYRQGADFYERDTLDQRLAEEEPDRIVANDEPPRLMDPQADYQEGYDEAAVETGDEGGFQSPEEAAIHIVDRPSEHGVVERRRGSRRSRKK